MSETQMVCVCRPGRRAEAQRVRDEVRLALAEGGEWPESWELDSVVLHALNDLGFKVREVLVDQWFGVSVEHFTGAPSFYVEADRFTDALCALYQSAAPPRRHALDDVARELGVDIEGDDE